MPKNDERICFFCRYDGVDSDCSGLHVCRNFKRKDLDRLIDNLDCIPLELMMERDGESE